MFVGISDAVVQAAMLAPANASVWIASLEALDLLSEAFDLVFASRGRCLAGASASSVAGIPQRQGKVVEDAATVSLVCRA